MQNYSKTIAAVIVGLLGVFGVGHIVTGAEVGDFIDTALSLVSFVFIWVERYKKGDITALGFKE